MALSTFFGIQTSLSGLLAHQRALDVSGHNVANASTVGYSRQEAVLGAAPTMFIPAGAKLDGSGAQLGSGVGVQDYRRVRDSETSILLTPATGQGFRDGGCGPQSAGRPAGGGRP